MEDRKNKRELYDLSVDPSEKDNVIAKHVDKANELTKTISAIVQNGRSTDGPAAAARDTLVERSDVDGEVVIGQLVPLWFNTPCGRLRSELKRVQIGILDRYHQPDHLALQ